MSRKVLIVYASRYGQTEKVANRIAEIVQSEGVAAEARPVVAATAAIVGEADDVILAGGIYFGRPARALARFVRAHEKQLTKRHTALVTVCNAPELGHDYADRFIRRTEWRPDAIAAFAGALAYRRYGWFVRFLMKRIAVARGVDADTSRNFEYTDWAAVDAFARDFVRVERTHVA